MDITSPGFRNTIFSRIAWLPYSHHLTTFIPQTLSGGAKGFPEFHYHA
jgi:hypothetical protein